MGIEKATAIYIPLMLVLLRATPNPPNETEETIQAYLDDPTQFVFIDTAVPVLCRMSPRPDNLDDAGRPAPDVPTPWWVWEGAFARAHIPIISATASAVKAEFPRSGPWPTYGDFPGSGTSNVTRRLDSKRQADEIVAEIAGITSRVSPRNPSMYEDLTTIDDLIAMAVP